MYARIFGILSVGFLAACGGSGSNPITGASDDGVVTDPGTDPSTVNEAFLFDTGKFLTANQFTYTPGATAGSGSIRINNLPFDGVSSQGGSYTPRAGVTLPNGFVFENTPGAGEDQYLAVILTSPTGGTGALVGAVATNVYSGFGYGGAYANRTSSGLPATRPLAYRYNGSYNGIRVIRQVGGGNNGMQLTTGRAEIDIDLQDLDLVGSIRGFILDRVLYDQNGNALTAPGGIPPIELVLTDIVNANRTTTGGTTRTTNIDGSDAQTGTWTGFLSGPNGEEVVGYLLLDSGGVSDRDPNHGGAGPEVIGRETGGFIAAR